MIWAWCPDGMGQLQRMQLGNVLLGGALMLVAWWIVPSGTMWSGTAEGVPFLIALLANQLLARPVSRRVWEHDGQLCWECGYPGSSEIGDVCTECGRQRTTRDAEYLRRIAFMRKTKRAKKG